MTTMRNSPRENMAAMILCVAGAVLPVLVTRILAAVLVHDRTAGAIGAEVIEEVRRYPLFSMLVYGAAGLPWLLLAILLRNERLKGVSLIGIPAAFGISMWCYFDLWRSVGDPARGSSTGGLGFLMIPLVTTGIVIVSVAAACRIDP